MSLAFTQEVIASGIVDTSKQVIPIVTGVGLVGGLCAKAFAHIPQGKVGVRVRNEKGMREKDKVLVARRLIRMPIPDKYKAGALHGTTKAGIKPIIPFTHSIHPVSVQDRPYEFQPITIDHGDRQYDVTTSIIWRVMKDGDNPYKAVFEIQDDELSTGVQNVCLAGIRSVLSNSKSVAAMQDQERVTAEARNICNPTIGRWGATLDLVQITGFAESPASLELRGALAQTHGLEQVAEGLGVIATSLDAQQNSELTDGFIAKPDLHTI